MKILNLNYTFSDLIWNYISTFFRICASLILLPFILKKMSSEYVGIWSIFTSITALTILFDFGFTSTFSRNITYVFNGIKILKSKGIELSNNENQNDNIDYSLLKGLILAMKKIYFYMAIFVFFILTTLGSYYIHLVIKNSSLNYTDIWIAWFILCFISTINISTLFYDCLLQGKGLIRLSKQISVLSQLIYLFSAIILINLNFGLVAIISSQFFSIIVTRILSKKYFFTSDLENNIVNIEAYPTKEIIKSIYPNALKLWLTSFGAFLIQRSSIFIGSLFLSLNLIASYSISFQFISIIANISTIYMYTYIPKCIHFRSTNNNFQISKFYLRSLLFFLLTFVFGSLYLFIFGNQTLNYFGSQTNLINNLYLFYFLLFTVLERNHAIAGTILLTNNEVPFFKASIFSGFLTIILLFIFILFFKLELLSLILAPGIAHLYNNWKWPYELFKQLSITKYDFFNILKE